MVQKQRLTNFTILAFLSIIFVFALGWDTGSSAIAQDGDCTPMAKNILDSVKNVCDATGRDQICYGSVSIEAEAQNGASNFRFEQKGDIANVADLANLRLQALDPVNSQWGVALLKVQASLPDNAPEDVTLLLFGNVQVANLGRDLTKVEMTVNTASNVRNRATAENTQVLGSVAKGETVIANGRITNPAGENWIRIEFETAPAGYGWVLGSSLSGDPSSLTAIQSSTEPAFGPMEAFTFSSQDDSQCGDVSNSGLMIQTPSGVGEISFFINEVDIQVGSTTFLSINNDNKMTVSTLEGGVKMEAFGVTQSIPPGSWSSIPLDNNGMANGAPELPKPYSEDEVLGLSSFIDEELFPENFDFVEPFNQGCLDDFNAEFNDGINDPFGDEVSTTCFLEYHDVYQEYYDEGLPSDCFNDDGTILDSCMTDFNNEWPSECYDADGNISDYCLEPDQYIDSLPDSCYNIYTGDIENECVGAFDNIEALPDSCFDESGDIADNCLGASGIMYDLPDSCYDNETGEILDECLDSFGSFDGDFELSNDCIDPSTGDITEACMEDPTFGNTLPDACFDPDTGQIYDECLAPYEEFNSAPDSCYDESTGIFDESCYSGVIDDNFGYGTPYRDEEGNVIQNYYDGTGDYSADMACDPNYEDCSAYYDYGSCDPDYEDCSAYYDYGSCDPDYEDCSAYYDDSYTCDPSYEDCSAYYDDPTYYDDTYNDPTYYDDSYVCDPDYEDCG